MNERFAPGKQKLWTGFKLSAGAAVAALAVACGSGETPPPAGFSRTGQDYSWSIRVDIQQNNDGNNFAQLYSNKKPSLTSDGGVNHLSAQDVYCKDHGNWLGDEAGCTTEFMKDYEISSPKRISVADNKGIK